MNREKELVKELIACVSRNPRIDGGFAVKRDLENERRNLSEYFSSYCSSACCDECRRDAHARSKRKYLEAVLVSNGDARFVHQT